MNSKVSESIFDDGKIIIPFAEVSHIERHQRNNTTNAINVIFKHSRWANDERGFEPNVPLLHGEEFLKSWCRYRHEVEGLGDVDSGVSEQLKEIWK